jgi:hypothetical protein
VELVYWELISQYGPPNLLPQMNVTIVISWINWLYIFLPTGYNSSIYCSILHLFVIFEIVYKLLNTPILPVHCDLVKPHFGTLHAIWLGLRLGCTLVIQLYSIDSRHNSRFFDCLAHPNLSATLTTDQKWPLTHLPISYQSLAECH